MPKFLLFLSLSFVLTSLSLDRARAGQGGRPQKSGEAHACCRLNKVNANGDREMGFSHQTTKHRFTLLPDGGSIAVSANDPGDAPTIAQVRTHLAEIAASFAAGDFSKPKAIHGRMPPGAVTMRSKRDAITYAYREAANGGEVRITTADARALAAVHSFLRFQIKDHATGDSPTVAKN